jgi:hypothetical protein
LSYAVPYMVAPGVETAVSWGGCGFSCTLGLIKIGSMLLYLLYYRVIGNTPRAYFPT